ncbi:MAG: efflux transporter outer membrane subunit [Neisseria sp.]|nr:efflux transporter outer membrane subunit [Neisseria sp.]
MKPLKPTLLALGVTAALSACTMAPNYSRPQVLAPDVPSAMAADNVQAADLAWQDYFADPRLRALIQAALARNADLRIATLNAEAARAQYGIARSQLLPSLGASGSGARVKTSADLSPTGQALIAEQYQAGLGVTAWELDLFGRVRSMSNSAIHQYFAAEYGRDAAQISIIAAVAKSYFAEKSAGEIMQYAQDTLKTREESYRLAKISHDAGVISSIQLNQSLSQIETAKAGYAAAETMRNAARNALAVLVGGQLPADLPAGLPLDQQFAGTIPAGLPSDILNRRPDVRAAEEALQAANAQIGAARAAFFPSITLTGSVGSASYDLDRLFSGPAAAWSFAPQITLPIFTWGRNKANLDLAHIRTNIAVAQYEQTVQNAFRDAADALNARRTLADQVAAQEKIATAAADVLHLTELRYRHGISGSLDLLDAQRQSFAAQTALIQSRQQLLNNRVDVYKVFGGGLEHTAASQQ